MIEKVKRPFCAKVLPTVYSESLSYYEELNKLVYKINEVIASFDELGEGILEEAKAYTDEEIAKKFSVIDSKIAEVNQLIDEINANYDSFVNYVNNEFDALVANVNNQINDLNNYINLVRDTFNGELENTYNRLVLMIQQNNDYLISEMGKFLNQIKVVNYFTGENVTIQEMFDYLAGLHLDDSITYTVMASRNKTYTQLVNMNINYTNLVQHGNTLFV